MSPGVHLVAAFSASLEGVIGQLRMEPETNEITAALRLLKTLPLNLNPAVSLFGKASSTLLAQRQVVAQTA
jgi:hypothetical protein